MLLSLWCRLFISLMLQKYAYDYFSHWLQWQHSHLIKLNLKERVTLHSHCPRMLQSQHKPALRFVPLPPGGTSTQRSNQSHLGSTHTHTHPDRGQRAPRWTCFKFTSWPMAFIVLVIKPAGSTTDHTFFFSLLKRTAAETHAPSLKWK